MKKLVLLILLGFACGSAQIAIDIAYVGTIPDANCASIDINNLTPDLYIDYVTLEFCALKLIAEQRDIMLNITQVSDEELRQKFVEAMQTGNETYDFFIRPGFLYSIDTVNFLNVGFTSQEGKFSSEGEYNALLPFPPIIWVRCDCPPPEGCEAFFLFRDAFQALYPNILSSSPY
jgi:hypothetical protein